MNAAMIALLPALWPIRNLTSELPCSPSNALPQAGEADAEAAIDAARAAFDGPWGALTPKDRGKFLLKLARIIQEEGESLARLEAKNTGHPIHDVRRFDLVRTVDWFEYFAGMATKIQGDVIPSSFKGVLNYTLREPLGVVGQIVPWNFPLMFVA